ncbi:MAG TPA: amidohydrolase [Fimbriimonas sp.]|nr:amidohydrolase [Fimbriimonas sp.]
MTLIEIRHDLHAHPQVRFEETYASALVQRELTALGIEFKAGLAKGTGVLGYLPATQDADTAPTIALRADMDALPIEEETGKPYTSTHPGCMHACGHDGHTTILIGAARALAAAPFRPNNVLFVFQPAEEGGGGGNLMVQDGCLNGSLLGKKADFMFGLHGWSTVKVGHVATKVGSLMASTDDVRITFTGQGGHAAAPSTTRDPIVAIAALITALQTVLSRNVDPFEQGVVTIGQVHGGTTHNIIPMSAWVQGTIRSMDAEVRELLCDRVRAIAEGVAATYGMEAKIELDRGYPVVVNDADAVARFMDVATSVLGAEFVSDEAKPTMGGEDFAYYCLECPSCFYQLGLIPEGRDDYESVHTPVFDFNDDAIDIGVRVMTALALS